MPILTSDESRLAVAFSPGYGSHWVTRWFRQAFGPPDRQLDGPYDTSVFSGYRWLLFLSDPHHRVVHSFLLGKRKSGFREFVFELRNRWLDALPLDPTLALQSQDLGGLGFDRILRIEHASEGLSEFAGPRDVGSFVPPEPSVAGFDYFYDEDLRSVVAEIYAADVGLYQSLPAAPKPVPLSTWEPLRDFYRNHNRSHSRRIVHHIGARGGLVAEIGLVAQAMVFAASTEAELVIDSSASPYFGNGWADYFVEICTEFDSRHESKADLHIRNLATGAPTPDELPAFDALKATRPDQLRIGDLQIAGYDEARSLCLRLLFDLNADSREAVEGLRRKLGLGSSYVALHIRRGDKVGDEDLYYPSDLYVDRLGTLDAEEDIFVMSDDYAAVEEVEAILSRRGSSKRVRTLCTPAHTGFDVSKVRGGKYFFGRSPEVKSDEAYRSYMRDENLRLLAEIEISTGSRKFVSTERSNVAKIIRMLHPRPDRCELMVATPELEELLGAMQARTGARQPLLR